MSFLAEIELDRVSPARLWAVLPVAVRTAAARAMLTSDEADVRTEASLALAGQLRFRPAFVQKLPMDRRVAYLARQVRPDDNLAGSLLLALHLGERRPLLAAFLDELGIPHDDGVIDEDHELETPDEDALARAVARLDEDFDAEDVLVYLATLVALDPGTWAGLRAPIEARARD